METIFTQLQTFITGIFGSFSTIITQADGNLIGLWLIVIPIFGLAMSWVARLLHSASGRRSKRRGG